MSKLAEKFAAQKPWAWLRISRAKYDRLKPWKNSGFSKEEYERILLSLPQDLVETLYEEARANILIDALFKESAKDND